MCTIFVICLFLYYISDSLSLPDPCTAVTVNVPAGWLIKSVSMPNWALNSFYDDILLIKISKFQLRVWHAYVGCFHHLQVRRMPVSEAGLHVCCTILVQLPLLLLLLLLPHKGLEWTWGLQQGLEVRHLGPAGWRLGLTTLARTKY